nr:unnamed protein product [Callosobruchus chinensis]
MVTPKFVDMENSFPEVVMAKINLDENEELGQEYNIESMTTLSWLAEESVHEPEVTRPVPTVGAGNSQQEDIAAETVNETRKESHKG